MYFVNSMSDFWHASADPAWQAEALDIMERNSQHIFQVLTKRPQNTLGMHDRIEKTLPASSKRLRLLTISSRSELHRSGD